MPRLKTPSIKSREDRPKNPRAEAADFKRRGKAATIKNVGKAKRSTVGTRGTAKAARDAASSRIKRTTTKKRRFRSA
jgi:hypothetical protein